MNNIENVSIGGYAFPLDSDAYKLVKDYLDELEYFYRDSASGKEIMECIEERLAELFYEKCGQTKVVGFDIALEALEVLGKPSAIKNAGDGQPQNQDEAANGDSTKDDSAKEGKHRHRLYRDKQNKFIAGVCSGIAAYFKIDVTLVRIVAVILSLFFIWLDNHSGHDCTIVMPLAYFVLWMCMPAANTVQQRLELYGQTGKVDEIQRNLKSGRQSSARNHSDFWEVLGRTACVFTGIVLVLVGSCGLVTSGILAAAWMFVAAPVWTGTLNTIIGAHPMVAPFIAPVLAKIAITLVTLIPCLAMIYGGVCMIFRLKSRTWHVGLILFLVWIVALISLCIWAGISAIPFI